MPSTALAADTGLPSFMPILARPTGRRGFMSGLAALPLIGGSVTLLGRPRAVAEPPTRQIMEAYKTWLHYEQRFLAWEMADLPEHVAYYGGTRRERFEFIDRLTLSFGTGDAARFHRTDGSSPASSRAALVLSTVGCDWRDDEAPAKWLVPVRRA